MIEIQFEGWFQCRLATDPDPADETRGISGMMRVYPGEPDLDRIIRFQPPFLHRSLCPVIGVTVKNVLKNGTIIQGHKLIGAKVNLTNDPIFKGDNGIVAEDGDEPIVPFILTLSKDNLSLTATHPDDPNYNQFPYKALQAKQIGNDVAGIRAATGIADPPAHFAHRAQQLASTLATPIDEYEKAVIRRRIHFLTSGNADAFFDYFMRYEVPLQKPTIDDPDRLLEVSTHAQWSTEIRFCAWDPDALSGYVIGSIEMN